MLVRQVGRSGKMAGGPPVTPTAPIDATHAESIAATEAIRQHVARLRRRVAVWELGERA